ncbi:MAG: acyl-CoA dehydrogenase [Polyangiaceae bacterium]|nr:acyl-CoA dehydrogenase [Polyangiaceae bacterium]
MTTTNPLLREADVDFLLYEVLEVERLCALPAFAEHGRDTFDLFIREARRLARDVLFPAYRAMDEAPPKLEEGSVRVHAKMRDIYPQLVALGLIAATRPADVGGQQMPLCVATFANAYLMAGNLSAFGYLGLTTGAGHLIEAFGDPALKELFLPALYEGRWTGTMALTEPHAGSSLADVSTVATPSEDGTYRIRGAKIFISGGDHDLTENIVHMTLARVEGAPAGIKGVSLFAVPKFRLERGALVDNDVAVAGAIHKIGWRGLPSLAMAYGDRGDCRGWLVGKEHRGISYMFQMMNEARLMVGLNGVATASVAYLESLDYARTRPQGRAAAARDPLSPQVPIIEHADVRRMLLRQKAIVEGGLTLIARAAMFADVAAHGADAEERARAQHLLDLLTPVAKSFPAEKGFESNALALQIHGGYGYSSEYLVEAWLRDQKLNSIHEGTTGIQSLDLLGRKVVAAQGLPLRLFRDEVEASCVRAEEAGVDRAWSEALRIAADRIAEATMTLGARGLSGDVDGMLLHSADYLEMFSIVVIAWAWMLQARAASGRDTDFHRGKMAAAQYWITTELPRVAHLAKLCVDGEDSYARVPPDAF